MKKTFGILVIAILATFATIPLFGENTTLAADASTDTPEFDISPLPVDADATAAAKEMYAFLRRNFGSKTISGIMTGDMSSATGDVTQHDDVRAVYLASGKYPALIGFDFMNATGRMEADEWYRQYTRSSIELAKDTYRRGGLPAFTWHWRDPSRSTDAFYTSATQMKISDAMNSDGSWNESSTLYQHIIKDIDAIADYLLELQGEGIACIFRPLHEASGGWFWWGREGAEPFRKLYRLIYHEMVSVKGVHNVIWVWNADDADNDWDPGSEYYDVVSADIYNKDFDYSSSHATFESLKRLTAGKKIIALSENGPIPDIDREVEDGAVWSWWMPWYNTWGGNFVGKTSPEEWKKCMNDNRVITLAENGDSISRNLEDYDFLTSFTEENYAAFPYIMQLGYRKKYETLKKQLRKQLRKGKMGIEQAACEYGIWFHKNFDAHYSIDTYTPYGDARFNSMHTDYCKLMEEYAPKPVSCKVDEHTWLVRVPSCFGDNPTWKWMEEAAEQYRESGCENLILDVRGNVGGNDGIWYPFVLMLVDHQREWKYENCFRISPYNVDAFVATLKDIPEVSPSLIESYANLKNSNEKFERIKVNIMEVPADTFPKRAAIIIDNATCSAGEALIELSVRGVSHKTKVYGKERTYGSNNTGNCITSEKSPHAGYDIFYPTCVYEHGFLNNVTFGEIGIKPDVHIDLPYPKRLTDNVDEWVLWVAKDLMK